MSINIDWLAPLGEELFDKTAKICSCSQCTSCPYDTLCNKLSYKPTEIRSYFLKRGYSLPIIERQKDLFRVISHIQSAESVLSCNGNCQSCGCKEECEYIDDFANEYYKTIMPYLKTT